MFRQMIDFPGNSRASIFEELGQILEWVFPSHLTGMDEAHEQISDVSPVFGFIKQRVLAVDNGLF